MRLIKQEIKILFLAITFLTRIRIPDFPYDHSLLRRVYRYFPLVGALIGACGGLVFFISTALLKLNLEPALVLSLMSITMLCGGLHEDGLADSCDAFFGGGDRPVRILEIMKDSRIGSFGALALFFFLLLKLSALKSLALKINIAGGQGVGEAGTTMASATVSVATAAVITAFIMANSLARFFVTFFLIRGQYVNSQVQSKSSTLVTQLSNSRQLLQDLLVASIQVVVLIFIAIIPLTKIFTILIVLLLAFFLLQKYYKNKIGGYTGDALGAAEQIFETIIYLALS
ncbi:MAG: adenosylcobinamide-GDP ribazoletransferase [Oligoflexia bacterium]|nr:adenosylcobinamide-GDP ribazoletransferase [Oligoflexia bacterium]